MNALLYFPGIMIVIMLATGLERAIRTVVLILEVQVSHHAPFTDSQIGLILGAAGCAVHFESCAELCF